MRKEDEVLESIGKLQKREKAHERCAKRDRRDTCTRTTEEFPMKLILAYANEFDEALNGRHCRETREAREGCCCCLPGFSRDSPPRKQRT